MPKFKSLIAVNEARDDDTYIAEITADIDDDGSRDTGDRYPDIVPGQYLQALFA